MANAILTITYIRSTFITDQTKFIENLLNGKQIGKFLDIQKTSPGPKTHFWDWNMKNMETRFHFRKFWKILKT